MDVRSNTERVLNFKLTSVMNLQAVFVPTVLLTKLGLCHNFNHVFEMLSGRKVTYMMPQQPVLSKSGDNSSSNLPNVQVLSPRVRRHLFLYMIICFTPKYSKGTAELPISD